MLARLEAQWQLQSGQPALDREPAFYQSPSGGASPLAVLLRIMNRPAGFSAIAILNAARASPSKRQIANVSLVCGEPDTEWTSKAMSDTLASDYEEAIGKLRRLLNLQYDAEMAPKPH